MESVHKISSTASAYLRLLISFDYKVNWLVHRIPYLVWKVLNESLQPGGNFSLFGSFLGRPELG